MYPDAENVCASGSMIELSGGAQLRVSDDEKKMRMKKDIKQLTGLRGVAACVVAVSHFDYMQWAPFRFIAFHNVAVDLFFCLSAFTLCLVYNPLDRRTLDLRAYGIARFARIYPLYLLGLVFAALTFIRWDFDGYNAYPGSAAMDFLRQLVMVNALPIVGNGAHWDLPSWSLSVEAFCYIAVFPLLFILAPRASKFPEAGRLMLILLLTAAAYYMMAKHFDWMIFNPGQVAKDPLAYWALIIRGICSFSAGWLAYLAWANKDAFSLFAGTNVDAVSVGIFLILAGTFVGISAHILLLFVWPVFIVGLMNERSLTGRALSCRPLVWLGEISYSLYLWHVPVMHLTGKFIPTLSQSSPLRLAILSAGSLLMATASYSLFEKSTRHFIRRALTPVEVARSGTLNKN